MKKILMLSVVFSIALWVLAIFYWNSFIDVHVKDTYFVVQYSVLPFLLTSVAVVLTIIYSYKKYKAKS